jgi:hypothetical protein
MLIDWLAQPRIAAQTAGLVVDLEMVIARGGHAVLQCCV